MRLAGIAHDHLAVHLALPRGQRGAAFEAARRFGEVPVWVEAGVAHVQSKAILRHLAERHGVLAGAPRALRGWRLREASRMGLSVPNLRFARCLAGQPPAVAHGLHARAEASRSGPVLDAPLSAHAWLLPEGPTIADVACCTCL